MTILRHLAASPRVSRRTALPLLIPRQRSLCAGAPEWTPTEVNASRFAPVAGGQMSLDEAE